MELGLNLAIDEVIASMGNMFLLSFADTWTSTQTIMLTILSQDLDTLKWVRGQNT